MIQVGTVFSVADKTSVVMGRCIKVLKGKKWAKLGEMVLLSVEGLDPNRARFLKPRVRKRFGLGSIHRALVVRSRVNYCRYPGAFLKFGENAGVIVNKKIVPLSSRTFGPILKEICMRWPSFGCISRCVI